MGCLLGFILGVVQYFAAIVGLVLGMFACALLMRTGSVVGMIAGSIAFVALTAGGYILQQGLANGFGRGDDDVDPFNGPSP